MSIREIAFSLGGLFVLAACGVALSEPDGAFRRVVQYNGMMVTLLSTGLVPRETRRPNALFGAEPPTPRPTAATFLTAAAFGAAGWLSTSLALLDGYRWLSWFAAFAGLLALGAATLLARWYFSSMAPTILIFVAFVLFSLFV